MKMSSSKTMIRIYIAAAIMLSAGAIYAQPTGNGQGGQPLGGSPPGGGTGAPIDGGAIFLLAGVAAYAHRRIKEKNEAISPEK